MQVNGQLICIQTIGSRNWFIQCTQQVIQFYIAIFWNFFLQLRIKCCPEFFGAAYHIFIELRLGLMHCPVDSAPKPSCCYLIAAIIIVQTMSCLVCSSKQAAEQLIIICGWTGIPWSVAGTNRMVYLIHNALIPVKSQQILNFPYKLHHGLFICIVL